MMWKTSHIYFSIFLSSGLYYEIQNNDIRMEMAFHEAFKQLQTRMFQAQVTKQRNIGTVEYIEEGRKVEESSLGPWGMTNVSSATAIKVEAPAGSLMNRTWHIVGSK